MFGNSLTPVVKSLLIINVFLFVVSLFIHYQYGIDMNKVLGLHYVNSDLFQPYQIFTHMFMHAYIGPNGSIYFLHIFSNMFALYMFGPALEKVWGAKRFLSYYLICGFGAALIQSTVIYLEMRPIETAKDNFVSSPTTNNLLEFISKAGGNSQFAEYYNVHSNDPEVVQKTKEEVVKAYNIRTSGGMVGASGAIFGILLGFGMLFPNTVLMLLFPPIPIKAKYFVILYGLLELYTGIHVTEGDNVAHFAHLGGMIFGFLIIMYWKKKRENFY